MFSSICLATIAVLICALLLRRRQKLSVPAVKVGYFTNLRLFLASRPSQSKRRLLARRYA